MTIWDLDAQTRRYSGSEPFIGVDYGELETRALRSMRTSSKSMNFANNYPMLRGRGAGYRSMMGYESRTFPAVQRCEVCKAEIHYGRFHSELECKYELASRQMQDGGCVLVKAFHRKVLIHAGIDLREEAHREGTTKSCVGLSRRERKVLQDKAWRVGSYAPVWAVLFCEEEEGVGHLTSLRRPLVQRLVEKIRAVAQDKPEQLLIVANHLLGGGPHKEACRAFLELAGVMSKRVA